MRLLTAVLLLGPALALAHGGQPRVTGFAFPAARPGGFSPDSVWAITDNQGFFVREEGRFTWLCEDAIFPAAGVRGLALEDETRWWVLTSEGLFLTEDGGCTFAPAPAPLEGHRPFAVSQHPERPAEMVLATDSFGRPNDVFRTDDGGRTWSAAGLTIPGRVTSLVRSPTAPDAIFATHEAGAVRSEDGGHTFERMKLGPAELAATPLEFRLLGAAPGRPDGLFAVVERLPESFIVRSEDGGREWAQVATVADSPGALVFDGAGRRGLLLTTFEGRLRTDDGGRTWTREPRPPERLECLARAPGSDRLWGCTNVIFDGAWAVGLSDDFGVTWRPALRRLDDVQARWPCPAATPTAACCQHLCPGLPEGAQCPGQAPGPGPTCGGEVAPDGGPGPADGGPDAGAGPAPDTDAEPAEPATDGGPEPGAPDAAGAPVPDAAAPDPDAGAPRRGGGGDCTQAPAPASPLGLLALLLAVHARRAMRGLGHRR